MTQYTKPTPLPAWAESAGGADVLQPSNAEIQAGWPLTSVPPSRKRFNWILKYLAQGVRYLMQMGIPLWDAAEDYPVNARVMGSNGKTYKALQTSINQDPTTAAAYWQLWGTDGRDDQLQLTTAFTTAGTAPNFTLTPVPAPTALAANLRFRVKFHAAGAGSDVLNIGGFGNKSIKQYDANGNKVSPLITLNQLADLEYDGVDLVILDPLPQSDRVAVAGGTADAITATYAPAIITLTQGLTVLVRAASANATTTPTFSPNGLASATIVKGSNAALAAGDIAGAGHWIELQYDTTLAKWVLQNPALGVTSNAVQASTTEITNETAVQKYVSPDRLSSSKRVAKAWVNFVGGTGAINSSQNVSSVTRNGVGTYTVNFTTAMADGNYAVMMCARSTTSAYGGALCHNVDPSTAPSTTSVKVNTGHQDDNSNTYNLIDPTSVYVAILGN